MKINLLFVAFCFSLVTGAYSQSTNLALPTADSTSSFSITNSGSETLLKLNGDAGFYMGGTYGTGAIPVTGAGTRLMWYPGKAAFRAGKVYGSRWDADSTGIYSVAFGGDTKASGKVSAAFNYKTTASGANSIAMGDRTTANGITSTAMGSTTTASGWGSTAMGYATTANGEASTASGRYTIASEKASFATGHGSTSSGIASFASGYQTNATENGSTAMGICVDATGIASTAIGYGANASGKFSTAIGDHATASGESSTAIGNSTTASGESSIAMGGYSTTASGEASTAMGYYANASGKFSTAMGCNVSTDNYQGAFIIGDHDGSTNSTAENQMTMRFAGGYILYSTTDLAAGVTLSTGDNSWSSVSDSTKKYAFLPVDGEGVLNKISRFNLRSWSYNGQDSTHYRHYGPMAQEFHSAFGHDQYGTAGNDTTLNQADFDGINLIAIQALEKRTRELKQAHDKILELNNVVVSQQKFIEELAARVTAVEAKLNSLDENKVHLSCTNISIKKTGADK